MTKAIVYIGIAAGVLLALRTYSEKMPSKKTAATMGVKG